MQREPAEQSHFPSTTRISSLHPDEWLHIEQQVKCPPGILSSSEALTTVFLTRPHLKSFLKSSPTRAPPYNVVLLVRAEHKKPQCPPTTAEH